MKSSISVLAAAILWGIISIFLDTLGKLGFDAMQIVAIRCLFASVLLTLYMLWRDPGLFHIDLRDLPVFFGTGVVSLAAFNYTLTLCLQMCGGAAIPTLLLYTAPAIVMLLSAIFFHERITARKLLSLGLTALGLCFITGIFSQGASISAKALLLGLASGFGYALYSIFGKLVVNKYSSVTITAYTFFMAAAASVPASGLLPKLAVCFTVKGLLVGIGLALFCTVMPFLLYTNGLRNMDAGKASVIATAEPLVAAVVSIFYYRETFTIAKVLGIVLILFAVTLLNFSESKKNTEINNCNTEEKCV